MLSVIRFGVLLSVLAGVSGLNVSVVGLIVVMVVLLGLWRMFMLRLVLTVGRRLLRV